MGAGFSVLTTMRHTLLFLAGYCFLPMAASMTGDIPFRGRPHTLYPTVHPDTNRADLSHIRGGEGLTMHYHDPYAAFPEIRSFATVQVSGFIHPAILLEHSAHVTSAQCNAMTSTITVTFGLRSVWAAALEDWKQHEKFLLIAYEDSCGLGRDSGERSVHLVRNFTSISDKMQIVAHMSEVPMTDAIHPDREVLIQLTTFDKHDTAPPTPSESSAQIIRRESGSSPQNNPPGPNEDYEDYELFSAMFWGDPPDDYISAEDFTDGKFDDTLVPGADNLGSRALEARGSCYETFNPFVILFKCFAQPILQAVLPDSVYRIFENLAQNVISALHQVLDEIGKKVDSVFAKFAYTPSGEVTFDTNKILPMTNTPEFGLSYPLADIPSIKYTGSGPDGKPSDKNSITGSFRMDCVGCRINGWMKYQSEIRFTVRNSKFIHAVVKIVDGGLDVAVGVGIKFDVALNRQLYEGNIFKLGLTKLQIPGIIIIGPFITLDVAFDVEIGAKGTFIAKTSMGWSNMGGKIDLINVGNSELKLVEKSPASQVSLDFEARLVATPSITAGLLFGVTILKGKFEVSAGVEAKASLPLTAAVAVAGTAGTGHLLAFRNCGGVQVSVVAKFEFYAIVKATAKGISKGLERPKPHPLFDYPVPLFDKCLPIGETRSTAKLRSDVVPPTLQPADPNQRYVYINGDIAGQKLQAIWLPFDPKDRSTRNVRFVPAGDIVDASRSIHRLFISSNQFPKTHATAGTYDQRVLAFDWTMMKNRLFSPVMLVDRNHLPQEATVLALRSDTGKDGRRFVSGVTSNTVPGDGDKNRYYPFICFFPAPKYSLAIMSITNDPVAGFKRAQDRGKQILDGKATRDGVGPEDGFTCQFLDLSISSNPE